MAVNAAIMMVKAGLLFLAPGLLLTRRLIGGRKSLVEWLAWSITLGAFVVSTFAWLTAAATFQRVSPPWLAASAAIVILFQFKSLKKFLADLGPGLKRARPDAAQVALLVIALAAFLFYFVKYDRDLFGFSCLHQSVASAIGLKVGTFPQPPPILFNDENEREGAAVLASGFSAAFGFPGMRIFLALSAVVPGLLMFSLCKRLFRSTPIAFAAFLIAALNPIFMMHSFVVNNTIAYWTATALLALLLWPESKSRLWEGLLTGLALGVRHIFILAAPAAAACVWLREKERRGKALFRWALGTALLCLPWLLRHTLAFGSPLAFESFNEYKAYPHCFMGSCFALKGMLNFPFYEKLIRTPYNPAPMMVWLPLFLGLGFGFILLGAALAGFAVQWKKPGRALLTSLWIAPLYLLLAVQENWMQPEKMAISLIFVPPLILWMMEGLAWSFVGAIKPIRWAALGACVAAVWLGGSALKKIDAPADLRMYQEYPNMRRERSEYVDYEREKMRSAGPMPHYRDIFEELQPFDNRLRAMREDLTHPAMKDRPLSPREKMMKANMPYVFEFALEQGENGGYRYGPEPADKDAVWAAIDLSKPLMGRRDFIQLVEGSCGAILEADGDLAQLRNMTVPWSEQPLSMTLFRESSGAAYLQLTFPSRGDYLERIRNFFKTAPAEWTEGIKPPPEPSADEEKPAPLPDMKACFRAEPGKPLYVVETLYFDPSRIYRWLVEFPQGKPEVGPPLHWLHN